MLTKQVILIGGYARAGKSTLMSGLAQEGFHTLSTSAIVHSLLTDVYKLMGSKPVYPIQDTKDRYVKFGNREYHTGRELLIELAEKVIVKNLSRSAFALGCIEAMEPNLPVAIEVFKRSEILRLETLLKALKPDYKIVRVNLRSVRERPDLDARNLMLDAIDVWADGTKQETLQKVLSCLG